jgi:hypothetical protein
MGSGPICAMVWEGRDAVKTGRSKDPAAPLSNPSNHTPQLSSVQPTPSPPPQVPSVVTTPSMSAATSATAPTASRTPRRRLLSGSRRVRSNHGSLLSTTGSTRSRCALYACIGTYCRILDAMVEDDGRCGGYIDQKQCE